MEGKLKIGLDIHGVTDSNPFFKAMAAAMIQAGHEIHIITGASTEKAKRDLGKLDMDEGKDYSTIFSITDYLIEKNVTVHWKDPSNPMFPDEDWNMAKAEYCRSNEINMHFDDSVVYGLYFVTPYAQVKQSITPELKIQGLVNSEDL